MAGSHGGVSSRGLSRYTSVAWRPSPGSLNEKQGADRAILLFGGLRGDMFLHFFKLPEAPLFPGSWPSCSISQVSHAASP